MLKYPGLSVAPMAAHYSATLQLLTAHAVGDAELGNVSKVVKAPDSGLVLCARAQWMGGDTSILPGLPYLLSLSLSL